MKIKSKNKKSLIIGIVVTTLIIIGTSTYVWFRSHQNTVSNANDNTFGKVNYDPPTADDKAYNDHIKQQLGSDAQNNGNGGTSTKKNVSITIVDSTQYGAAVEVRAFIPGVTESDGTCTFTFTNGTTQVVRETAAHAEAQTTPCGNLSVDKSVFNPAGSWSLVVSYASSTSTGKSDTKTVEIH